ncbi:MAG: S-methyl-5-thioribose-1-phosphate isomerase, partial [Bdellovibrionales bacterium]|nr:S-methyl-5-thioribose-1-phosphate isomerase [Bdellovibrionales bacterium]
MKLDSIALKLDDLDLRVIDQQVLPCEEKWLLIESPQQMIDVIQQLKVRGAPLIGVAAALALGVWSKRKNPTAQEFLKTAQSLRDARPTAVNLMYAIDRMIEKTQQGTKISVAYDEACAIFAEDVQLCQEMAKVAAEKIQPGDLILTHCNTGALATAGRGTALGAIT